MQERKLISFDWALKRLLRSKANFEILEGFLTELLKAGGTSLYPFSSSEHEVQAPSTQKPNLKPPNPKTKLESPNQELKIVEYPWFKRKEIF